MKLTLIVLCCVFQAIVAKYIDSHHPILFPPQSSSSRIVGGVAAKDGAVPFQCSMQSYKLHFCGCSIISSEWIVTAAHCVRFRRPDYVTIYVGSNDLTPADGTYYRAKQIIAHEEYNRPNFANDIALIRVHGPIVFTDKVQPIEYSSEEVPDGAVLQLTGWGAWQTDESLARHLQIIKLNAVQTEKCRKIYASVHDSHICTFTKVGEGSCNGDSGGPLVYNNKLVGIVNFGVPCAVGYPDAYAKVEYLFDWIKNNTAS